MLKYLLIIFFTVSFTIACEQQENDRCEINDDCESPLICCIPQDGSEGTCQYEENCSIEKKNFSDENNFY
ncbi:MAG: hypothetical protein ACQES9_04260 [Myxococcota bacterium]